jgi:hypothetical protein
MQVGGTQRLLGIHPYKVQYNGNTQDLSQNRAGIKVPYQTLRPHTNPALRAY